MRFWTNDRGHSSLSALLLIILLSTLLVMGTLLYQSGLQETRRAMEEMQFQQDALELAAQIQEQLALDPTPESHGPTDPVWTFIETYQGPYDIELVDMSSRLNPNWLRWKLFEETELSRLIQSGETPQQLQDRRSSHGFITDLNYWEETFGEDNLKQYFTLNSQANINVTDEESLERLYVQRVGQAGSASFRSRIQEGLQEGRLWSEEELPEIWGAGGDALYPVVNASPQFNVHYIDEFLLECLMSYPYMGEVLDGYQGKLQLILDRRKNEEITTEELEGILDVEEEQLRLLEYLDVSTEAWELRLIDDHGTKKKILFQSMTGTDYLQ